MINKVFVDTDIIYDLLASREPFYHAAAKLFTLADKRKINIYISALSFANIHYLISKQKSSIQAKQALRNLRLLVHVTGINEKIIDLALNSDFSDFEDACDFYRTQLTVFHITPAIKANPLEIGKAL